MILRLTLLVTLFLSSVFGYSSKAVNAYAVSIFDENKQEEKIQGIHKTTHDYNGVVYTKIYAFGTFLHDQPNVNIGNSKGELVEQKPIVKNNLLIGYEMLFKHYTVQSGYLEVYIGQKLFNRSVFVH
jgi:hypothetical protein